MNGRPRSTRDLRPTERRFVTALQQLGYGHFEALKIQHGELVLDPWPTTVRNVKFDAQSSEPTDLAADEFALKQQVAELFDYVRSVDAGEIRALEVRHGLPFSMEIELAGVAAHRSRGGGDA